MAFFSRFNIFYKRILNHPVLIVKSASARENLARYYSSFIILKYLRNKKFEELASILTPDSFLLGFKDHLKLSTAVLPEHLQKEIIMENQEKIEKNGKAILPKVLFPPKREGMKVLDRSAFDKEIQVPALFITNNLPHLEIQNTIKILKPYLLKVRKCQSITSLIEIEKLEGGENEDEKAIKRIYLHPELIDITNFDEFLESLEELNPKVKKTAHIATLKLTYENWNQDHIIKSILPDEHSLASFSIIGHIIHLNLREHLLPYKEIIGEVLLDKLINVKTIVNKLQNIDNTFRTFQMEIIAGEPRTDVKVKENNCQFEFDFAKVYWNPRLSTEHEKIVKNFLKHGDVLFDVFAGIGPFSIPAGRKKCQVLANDLNSDSSKWLKHNVILNKVSQYVTVFNKDGRNFIQEDLSAHLKKILNFDNPPNENDYPAFNFDFNKCHVTMNLPGLAVSFLDSFWNILPGKEIRPDFNLIVHVYCFIKGTEGYKEKAVELVEENLGHKINEEGGSLIESAFVRNVAPNKEMLRVSFKIPNIILTSEKPSTTGENKPLLKRKLSEIEDD